MSMNVTGLHPRGYESNPQNSATKHKVLGSNNYRRSANVPNIPLGKSSKRQGDYKRHFNSDNSENRDPLVNRAKASDVTIS
jgi:hypothetical protein